MTRWLAAIVTALGFSLAFPTQASAQSGFSGRWTLVSERSTVQLPQGPIVISALGSDLTIQQTPDGLIVGQANSYPLHWFVMFDGSESRTVSVRGDIGAKDEKTYRGEWHGDTFVVFVTSKRTWDDGRPSQAGHSTFEFSMNPDGTLRVAMPIANDGTMGASVYRWLEAVD